MQRMIFQVKHLHLAGQGSSRAKHPHEVRAGVLSALLVLALCFTARAQVNSGSTGSDGALDYSAISVTTNIVIDMHDHPTGIYNYTYVNIPANVGVSFIPNGMNTPVVWLVQSNCVIGGTINLNGQSCTNSGYVGYGGPGGYAGGNMGGAGVPGGNGLGPGGGMGATGLGYQYMGGSASFATTGDVESAYENYQAAPGGTYGNVFNMPLVGGSGGGGSSIGHPQTGGGGGGAILIAASGSITLTGQISADGGPGSMFGGGMGGGGSGSGGAIRLVATTLSGSGAVSAVGGQSGYSNYSWSKAGNGRIRFDALVNTLSGQVAGGLSRGFQPIIIPAAGQGVQLSIASVAGASVSATPNGQLLSPDAIIPGQQANPIPVVVICSNLPLNTPITVTVTPANGSSVSAVGYNTTGTTASSTATIAVNMPRGGGYIYATAATAQ